MKKGMMGIPVQLIDPRLVRATAVLSASVLTAASGALLTDRAGVTVVLLIVQMTAFMLGWRNPKHHPYRHLARRMAVLFPAGPGEHPLPVRFAALVGVAFTGPALVATLSGFSSIAFLFAAACAVAAALNGFGGICLACKLYPRIQRLTYYIQPRK
jgi:hypothetical protein